MSQIFWTSLVKVLRFFSIKILRFKPEEVEQALYKIEFGEEP